MSFQNIFGQERGETGGELPPQGSLPSGVERGSRIVGSPLSRKSLSKSRLIREPSVMSGQNKRQEVAGSFVRDDGAGTAVLDPILRRCVVLRIDAHAEVTLKLGSELSDIMKYACPVAEDCALKLGCEAFCEMCCGSKVG